VTLKFSYLNIVPENPVLSAAAEQLNKRITENGKKRKNQKRKCEKIFCQPEHS
jgi:hypothetical protein